MPMVSEEELERRFELGLNSFANEAQLFTCLLNSMVYAHAPISDDSKNLRLIQFRHPDGFEAIPVFTSATRSRRAASRSVKVVRIRCSQLFKVTAGAILMVNPNDGGPVLYPEEVERLLRTGTLEAFEKLESECPFDVHIAEEPPAPLVEVLRSGAAASPFIKSIYVLEKRTTDGSSDSVTLLLYLGVEPTYVERGARAAISAIQNMNPRLDQIIDVAVYDVSGTKPAFLDQIGANSILAPRN